MFRIIAYSPALHSRSITILHSSIRKACERCQLLAVLFFTRTRVLRRSLRANRTLGTTGIGYGAASTNAHDLALTVLLEIVFQVLMERRSLLEP